MTHNASNSNFPSFLQPVFGEDDLDTTASLVAVLAPDGTILWVNRHWRESSSAHGTTALPGSRYFDGISGPLRSFFEDAFSHAMRTETVYELDYECYTPDEKYAFHLRALPVAGEGLVLEHSLVRVGGLDAPAHDAAAEEYIAASGMVSQCSNCRRVHHPKTDAWHWVPEWVRQPHRQTSHGICSTCMRFYWRLERPRRSRT